MTEQEEAFYNFVVAADKFIEALKASLAEEREANQHLRDTIKRLSRTDAVDTGAVAS